MGASEAMADLIADGSALAAVRAFLTQNEYSSESENDAPSDFLTSNPKQLEGSATFLPQAAHLSSIASAQRRLASSLQKKKRQRLAEEEDRVDTVYSSEENESRVTAFGKRSRPHSKKKTRLDKLSVEQKNACESKCAAVSKDSKHDAPRNKDSHAEALKVPEKKKHDVASNAKQKDAQRGTNVHTGSTEIVPKTQWQPAPDFVKHPETSHRHKSRGAVEDASNGKLLNKRMGRKKIRSRQKNLRRDKRPKASLPSHLTEATLLGGRVQRPPLGNEKGPS